MAKERIPRSISDEFCQKNSTTSQVNLHPRFASERIGFTCNSDWDEIVDFLLHRAMSKEKMA